MIVYSRFKNALRALISLPLFSLFFIFFLSSLSMDRTGSEQRTFALMLSIFTGLMSFLLFWQLLIGLKGLFGERTLLEIKGEELIFYNKPLKAGKKGIRIPIAEIASVSVGEIDALTALAEAIPRQAKEDTEGEDSAIFHQPSLLEKASKEVSNRYVYSSKIASISLVFKKDVLANHSMFKDNIWYNRSQRKLDIQTNFARKKDILPFIQALLQVQKEAEQQLERQAAVQKVADVLAGLKQQDSVNEAKQ